MSKVQVPRKRASDEMLRVFSLLLPESQRALLEAAKALQRADERRAANATKGGAR